MKLASKEDLDRLMQSEPTPVYISGVDMLYLLGGLQLLLRHPRLKDTPTEKVARVFAEELEARIVRASPGMAELCKRGWDPKYDVE